MTKTQKIIGILGSLLMIVAALYILTDIESGYRKIMWILSAYLAIAGARELFYFFTMARFMVGGRMILYEGIILLDFGVFSATLSDDSKIYIIIYLAVIHAFGGLVSILRALEAKRFGAGVWKLKSVQGILDMAVAFMCIYHMKSADTAIYIYSFGVIYSACLRMASYLRKDKLIYIQ